MSVIVRVRKKGSFSVFGKGVTERRSKEWVQVDWGGDRGDMEFPDVGGSSGSQWGGI